VFLTAGNVQVVKVFRSAIGWFMFTPVRVDFWEMEVVTRSCAVGMDSAVSCQIEVEIYQSISTFVDKDTTMFIPEKYRQNFDVLSNDFSSLLTSR
jgi:hypothetical protein